MSAPADYIDVTTIDTKRNHRETVAKHVRETVRRFGDQEFTARHVYGVVFKIPRFYRREKLYTCVKASLNYLVKRNRLEMVTQGEFNQYAPTIYRAIQSKASQTENH